jgi:hypothetical protein
MRPKWGSKSGLTDRLIVGRNVTLTLTCLQAPVISSLLSPNFLLSTYFLYGVLYTFLVVEAG